MPNSPPPLRALRVAYALSFLVACSSPRAPERPETEHGDLGSARAAPGGEASIPGPAVPSLEPASAAASPNAPSPGSPPGPSLEALLMEPQLVDRDFGQHFAAEGVEGAFVAYDVALERGWAHARPLAKRGFLPCSTFKIPHTLIGLEENVLTDERTVLPWQGERSWNPDWNYDRTLAEAFRFSVVSYYQQIARRVGPERMQSWLRRLKYGNQDLSGPSDLFWLRGGLRISALDQIGFLQRLNTGRLPVSEHSIRTLHKIMRFGARGETVVFGKTGSGDKLGEEPAVMWFVGWLERRHNRIYFATLLVDPPAGAWAASRQVSDRILTELGYL